MTLRAGLMGQVASATLSRERGGDLNSPNLVSEFIGDLLELVEDSPKGLTALGIYDCLPRLLDRRAGQQAIGLLNDRHGLTGDPHEVVFHDLTVGSDCCEKVPVRLSR